MKYLILDYTKLASKIKKKHLLFKFSGLFEQYEKYKQYKQLKFIAQEKTCCDMDFIYITIQIQSRDLQQFDVDKLKKKLGNRIEKEGKCRFLTCRPELVPYIPSQLEICEDADEVYINLLKNYYIKPFVKKHACLMFLDDGTRDAASYIRQLSKDWNYVTVSSVRHEELEAVYRELYEEEGLMIQCTDYGRNRLVQERAESTERDYNHTDKPTIIIDLTTDWKGIHRIYPENSYVYDITFSREKQAYLKAKQVRLSEYVQIVDIRKS